MNGNGKKSANESVDWDAKELRGHRMQALKNCTALIAQDKMDLRNIFKEAQLQADYVYNGLGNGSNVKPNEQTTIAKQETKRPTAKKPTKKQQVILNKIYEGYDLICPDNLEIDKDLVKEKIFERFGKYPELDNSVKTVIRQIDVSEVTKGD